MGRPFYSSCVGWRDDRLDVLIALQDEADDITLDDLRDRVDPDDWTMLVSDLGYADPEEEGLKIEQDYHVSYHLHRETGICFVKHSAIEYVFAGEEEIDGVHERLLDEACENDFAP